MIEPRYVTEGEELVLAIYFHTTGFGYTLMKNPIEVVSKGMIVVTPADNKTVMQKVKKLIRKTKPERIVLENHKGKGSNKCERICKLLLEVTRFSKRKGIAVSSYSREQIKMVFSNWSASSRYQIARVIASNVEAFENLIFEKPIYPKIEHFRSPVFDSASLGITHYYIST